MAEIENIFDSWEGHTHAEVEAAIKSSIAMLQGGNYSQIAVSIVGSLNRTFVATAEKVSFFYKVNSTVDGTYNPDFTVEITIGNSVITITDVKASSADDEIETPNLAPYLAQIGNDVIASATKVNTNNAQMNQATLEFLCDLIDKQSIYIQEIESKYKSLLEGYTFRKMIIENKQSILKSINQCTLNRFINKNYEQEQKIRELEKENAILKIEKKNFNMQSYQPIMQLKQPKIKMPEENKTNINKQINRNLLSALNKVKKSKSKIGLYKNKENSKENFKKSEQIEHSYSLGSLHSISFTNKLSYRNCILK